MPKSLFALVPLGLEQPDCPGGPSPCRQEEAVPASSALDCQVVYFCPSILSFSCMGASPYRSVAPPLPAVHLVPGKKQSPGGWSWDGWGSFCQVEALGLKPLLFSYLIPLISHDCEYIASFLYFTVFSQCQFIVCAKSCRWYLKKKKTDWDQNSFFYTYFSNAGEMNVSSHPMTRESFVASMPLALYLLCIC